MELDDDVNFAETEDDSEAEIHGGFIRVNRVYDASHESVVIEQNIPVLRRSAGLGVRR